MALIKDKLKTFEALIVEHRRFGEIQEELLDCIQNPVRGTIPVVIGPTGVGKTRLKEYVHAILTEYTKINSNLGLSTPLLLEARRPETGEFNWKSFYDQGLRRLGEPSLERKVNLDKVVENLRLQSRNVTYRILTTSELRELYEQALDLQRPISVFIDEAQSIGYCKSDERRMANLDVIKGLSNSGKTAYVLFATYEARNLLRCNAQLARRVHLIDFQRYGSNKPDREELISVVQAICTEVDFTIEPQVIEDWGYFYNYSLGCVGILAQWLARALNHAYRNKRTHVARRDLDATKLKSMDLLTIADEINTFKQEYRLEKEFDAVGCLKDEQVSAMWHPPDIEKQNNSHGARLHKRPGARDPFRDPVGVNARPDGAEPV